MPSQRVHTEVTAVAPASRAFALLSDLSTWPRWGRWEVAVLETPDPDGGGGVGAIRRLESRTWGQRVVVRERVDEVVPDHKVAYTLLSGLPLVGYRAEVDLRPEGDRTVIAWTATFDPQTWGTGWFYRLVLQRFLDDTARALARAAEGG